ncbi:PTPA-CTERM sorting domain-containing protein [Pseudomonas fluorescens]|uniref:PTPA-CTERM sorting domain-containing protein n=1 Tax=Pseudomonas sp. GL-RE-29 TaxID=2832375 RepID=UPI001CC11292
MVISSTPGITGFGGAASRRRKVSKSVYGMTPIVCGRRYSRTVLHWKAKAGISC